MEEKKKPGPKKKVVETQPKIEEVIVTEDTSTVLVTVDDVVPTVVTVTAEDTASTTVSVTDVTSNTVTITNDDLTQFSYTAEENTELQYTPEATGDTPEEDWPEEVKKEWFTPRVYDENRPWINIGVVCGMKEMKYREVKKQLDMVLWKLPPWEYKHRIHGLLYSTNYFSVKRYAETRKKEFQTCPIYYKHGPRARLMAFEHLIKQTKGGVILILKDKEDGAIAKLIQMANAYGIKTIVVEY